MDKANTETSGWVRDMLSLISPQENPDFCSTFHQKAFNCYRLLWLADKADQNGNIENYSSYRKN